MFEIIGGLIVFTLAILISGIKAVKDGTAMVIYRSGKIARCVGPGLQFVSPFMEKGEVINTRIVTLPIAHVSETTLDQQVVKVSAVLFYQVADPKRCASKITDVDQATQEVCEVSLRTMVGQHDLQHLITDRHRINFSLKTILERRLREFGVRVVSIEVKEIQLSREAQKAISRAISVKKNGAFLAAAKPKELESFLRLDPLRD